MTVSSEIANRIDDSSSTASRSSREPPGPAVDASGGRTTMKKGRPISGLPSLKQKGRLGFRTTDLFSARD
jgi:hypothetical protein